MAERRIRILVIDGEANQRQSVIDLLQNNNLYVDAAATADQTFSLITQSGEPYDLALIDDFMPGSSPLPPGVAGLQMMARIKALCPATEIIAFIDQRITSIEKVFRAGAFRYLTKPFNLTELAILVLQVVKELKTRESERKTLERFKETSTALLADQSESEVLGCILRAVQGQLSKGLLGSASLDEILEFATGLAADLLGADSSDIILRGRNEALVFSAATGWEMMTARPCKLDRRNWSYVDYAIRAGEPVTVFDYTEERRFGVPRELLANGFRSGLIVPISIGNEVMGTMSVHTRACRHFTRAETTLLSIVTHQAAIAIKNVQQYESIRRHSASLHALYNAGKAITGGLELGRKQMLDRIVEQAVECLTSGKGLTVAFGTIQLYDEATGELHFESTCCSRDYPEVRARLGEVRPIKQRTTTGERIGISGRTVLAKAPQIVDDVSKDPDYVQFDPLVRSALTVPLVDKERVIGVLGMESNQLEAFDEDDQDTLLGLAELAVIAIRNAQQYDDLRKTRTLAEARTALAWMGMTSSTWRHMVHGHAITIQDLVELAISDLNEGSQAKVRDKLVEIADLAMLIQKHPITAPLSTEEGMRSILVNALVQERMRQLWESGSNRSVALRFNFTLPSVATVRANPDWLTRALGVLVDNAIDAMESSNEKVLIVSSHQVGKAAQIEITDTGKGMPPDILDKILQKPIEHPKETKKLGLGLLMARLIVQVYGGDIECKSTGPMGTTMVLSLPLET